jgi:hypothetical protein
MAAEKFILESAPEEFVQLCDGDVIAFVSDSEGGSVFKYIKDESHKYNNGYLVVILRDKELAYPIELSHSSIVAPYKCTAPFTEGVNKGFANMAKRTHAELIVGTKLKVTKVATVPFKKKDGDTIDWRCYELTKMGGKPFVASAEEQQLIDNFVVERLAKKNNG